MTQQHDYRQKSLDHFYTANWCIKMYKTSWTISTKKTVRHYYNYVEIQQITIQYD